MTTRPEIRPTGDVTLDTDSIQAAINAAAEGDIIPIRSINADGDPTPWALGQSNGWAPGIASYGCPKAYDANPGVPQVKEGDILFFTRWTGSGLLATPTTQNISFCFSKKYGTLGVYDQASAATVIGTLWARGTGYLLNDLVSNGTNVYRCTLAGTSLATAPQSWAAATAYVGGDQVNFNGTAFVCVTAGTSTPASAPAWAPNTPYTVGQYVSSQGNIYLCITSGTSSATMGPSSTDRYGTNADGTAAWRYCAAPVGTVASIPDGTVVWAYSSLVGPQGALATDVIDGTAKWRYVNSRGRTVVVRVDNADSANQVGTRLREACWMGVSAFNLIAKNDAPAWVAETYYAVPSQMISHGGNRYALLTPGMSASSDTPNWGIGSDITDGTAHWRYLCANTNAWVSIANDRPGTTSNMTIPPPVNATGFTQPASLAGGTNGIDTITVSTTNSYVYGAAPVASKYYSQFSRGSSDFTGYQTIYSMGMGKAILIDKAITLQGDVDGEGNPITVLQNKYPYLVPSGRVWTTGTNVHTTVRVANTYALIITGGDVQLGTKAKISNLKFDGGSVGEAYVGLAFKPFDEENLYYYNILRSIMRMHELRTVYPAWDATSTTLDTTGKVVSNITRCKYVGMVFLSYYNESTCALNYEDCEFSSPFCEASVPKNDTFGVGTGPVRHANGVYGVCTLQGNYIPNWHKHIRDCSFTNMTFDFSAAYKGSYADYGKFFRLIALAASTGTIEDVSIRNVRVDISKMGLWYDLVKYAIFLDAQSSGTLSNVKIVDSEFKGASPTIRLSGAPYDCLISNNRVVSSYIPSTPYPATLLLGAGNCDLIKNDYKDSGYPSLAVDDNALKACIWLLSATHDNTVFESGGFPAGQGGANNHVVNEGINNRIVGESARSVAKPAGIGEVVRALLGHSDRPDRDDIGDLTNCE